MSDDAYANALDRVAQLAWELDQAEAEADALRPRRVGPPTVMETVLMEAYGPAVAYQLSQQKELK